MKLYKTKSRLIISAITGVVAVLIYIMILQLNGFEVNESNLFIALMLPGLLLKLFLFFSSLSLTITSILVLLSQYKSKHLIYLISISFVIALLIGIPELRKIQSLNLYELTEDNTLNPVRVIELYEKAMNKGDIRAISNIAIHPNLPDSIQEKLSGSEIMEVRRKIAWETDSEGILRKLSTDSEYEVRMAVATNKSTPLEIVDKLRSDRDEYVKNTAFSMYQARK